MSHPERPGSSETLEGAILALLSRRGAGKTICPSEVARRLGGADWRNLMEPVREAAWRLEARGRVVVLQGGQAIARSAIRGPIRISLRESRHPGKALSGSLS